MGFSVYTLFAIATAYLLLLFLVAWVTDRGLLPARLVRHPLVYVFSLGVYCSAWAVYGSVGFAYQYGYNYLAYFLGISGVFLLAPILLAPILRLTTTYQLGSLADLFAFRFRSRAVGALTTFIMVFSMLPLLAMQLKAVAESVSLLATDAQPLNIAALFCLLILMFAILFGARHSSAREKHEGLVVAMALESIIKIGAFVAIGLIALFGVFDGPEQLNQWLDQHPEMLARLYFPLQDGTWHSLVLAFFVSAVVMPHMFHMAFTENLNPQALVTASWAVPLMLLAMAICVPLILWASMSLDLDLPPDYFALGLGAAWHPYASLLAFVAGIAGASGILIVATLALSGMILHHWVLPLRAPQPEHNIYRWLLWARRGLITLLLLLAYLFYSWSSTRHSLTTLAVLSFVATLQFVPGLISTLFWPGGNRKGMLLGMIGGFTVWLLALALPSFSPALHWVFFTELLGIRFASPASQWHNIALLSVAINGVLFTLTSLLTPSSPAEQTAGQACAVDSLRRPYRWKLEADNVDAFISSLSTPLGSATATREVKLALRDLSLPPSETRPYALRRLRDQLETNLSGLLGPSVAHQLVDTHLPYKTLSEQQDNEDIQFIESRLEQYRSRLTGLAAELDSLRRFHRQTLLELPMGVVSLGADDEVIGWNHAMEKLTGISGRRMIGSRLAALPEPWRSLLEPFAMGEQTHCPRQSIEVQGVGRWISLHKSWVAPQSRIRNGQLKAGQVIVVEDITEIMALEFQAAHNERLASIGRLAAGVAHEIGNPVTAIACLSQNLDHSTSSEELSQSAKQILEQTRRITRIVESLISFSHSGQLPEQHWMPVNIATTVDEAIALLRLDPDRRQQVFENRCHPQHQVPGDSQRLMQVFINLFSNAADASPPEFPVIASSTELDDAVIIQVEDHGHGIPDNLLDNLFEPFVTSKPVGRGTGLGLSVVYSIIKDHQGTITIESPIADGRGTRFIIRLPRASDAII